MTKKRGDILEHSQPSSLQADGQPAWLRKRLDWFMDLRFGLFIHWGPCCQWDCYESWPLVPADKWARPDNHKCWIERGRDIERFTRDYWNLNKSFNPAAFDPDAWAELARSAGMRYVTFTTKHCDGFCMFDTATTDYRITHADCPFHGNPRANVAREVFEAFRKRGLGISCYFSKPDWHSPFYWSPDAPPINRHPNYDTRQHPEKWRQFVAFAHRQVEELMTDYGRIDVLWLDGGWVRPPDEDFQMDKLAAMARARQPGLIIADRTVGGRYEDFVTPEQKVKDLPPGVPWEACLTLGKFWKYVPNDVYKSARAVINLLIETASKGGNLLLGVGPDPSGVIPPEAAARLREVGRWLRVNGEAIYGTRPVNPRRPGGKRFTSKADWTYAFIPEAEGAQAANRRITIEGLGPEPGSELEILGVPGAIPWEPAGGGFQFVLPETAPAGYARVARFHAAKSL